MMKREEVFPERAVTIARLVLTRNPNVDTAEERTSGHARFLRVRINPANWIGQEFAVSVRWVEKAKHIGDCTGDGRALEPILQGNLDYFRRGFLYLSYPMMYMIVCMETDEVYYGWLKKPGTKWPDIETPELDVTRKWEKDTHLALVHEVRSWYESGKPRRPIIE